MCCAVLGHSVVSESLWPHELEHSRFLCPWRFSRQEYWSGLSCPLPGDLPIPGINLWSPALRADSSQFEPPGKPRICTNPQELFCLWSQIQNVCQTSFLGSPLRLWEGLYFKKYFLVWFFYSFGDSSWLWWWRWNKIALLWLFGEGKGNLLQCSCLENPRDGEARWAVIYGVIQSRTRLKRLST